MDPVVHFEMPADDMKRAMKFYEKTFDWKMQQMGAGMGNYIVTQTTELGSNGRPKNPGAINGGLYPRQKEQGSHIVIAVKDVEASMKKVIKNGGKVSGKPMDIPNVGRYVAFTDTEGNAVVMLQPKM